MHVFLHFGTFGLKVLQLFLASKLSELEQFEKIAPNNDPYNALVLITLKHPEALALAGGSDQLTADSNLSSILALASAGSLIRMLNVS